MEYKSNFFTTVVFAKVDVVVNFFEGIASEVVDTTLTYTPSADLFTLKLSPDSLVDEYRGLIF